MGTREAEKDLNSVGQQLTSSRVGSLAPHALIVLIQTTLKLNKVTLCIMTNVLRIDLDNGM